MTSFYLLCASCTIFLVISRLKVVPALESFHAHSYYIVYCDNRKNYTEAALVVLVKISSCCCCCRTCMQTAHEQVQEWEDDREQDTFFGTVSIKQIKTQPLCQTKTLTLRPHQRSLKRKNKTLIRPGGWVLVWKCIKLRQGASFNLISPVMSLSSTGAAVDSGGMRLVQRGWGTARS